MRKAESVQACTLDVLLTERFLWAPPSAALFHTFLSLRLNTLERIGSEHTYARVTSLTSGHHGLRLQSAAEGKDKRVLSSCLLRLGRFPSVHFSLCGCFMVSPSQTPWNGGEIEIVISVSLPIFLRPLFFITVISFSLLLLFESYEFMGIHLTMLCTTLWYFNSPSKLKSVTCVRLFHVCEIDENKYWKLLLVLY